MMEHSILVFLNKIKYVIFRPELEEGMLYYSKIIKDGIEHRILPELEEDLVLAEIQKHYYLGD